MLSIKAARCVVHNVSQGDVIVVGKTRFYSLIPICSVIFLDLFFFSLFNGSGSVKPYVQYECFLECRKKW